MESNKTAPRAVIMAGGEGSRLRPITGAIPKPLAPVMGEPVLDHILRLLAKTGVRDAAMTLMYRGELIEQRYGDKFMDINLRYFYENLPQGTAGGVRETRPFIDTDYNGRQDNRQNTGDCFLVLSGDALFDFDLLPAIDYHLNSGAAATAVLTRVENPLEYGIALGDFSSGAGRIERFIEKPPYSMAYTDLVNTGIYIFSRKIFDYISPSGKCDFGREVFPALTEHGLLHGCVREGYWCDIGGPEAYYRCNFDAADGCLRTIAPSDSGNIIGNNCTVSGLSKLNGCILHENVVINKSCTIDRSIICGGVNIDSGVKMYGSIIGAGAVIGGGAVIIGQKIQAGVKIAPKAVLESGGSGSPGLNAHEKYAADVDNTGNQEYRRTSGAIAPTQTGTIEFNRGFTANAADVCLPALGRAVKKAAGCGIGVMSAVPGPAGRIRSRMLISGSEACDLGEGGVELADFAAECIASESGGRAVVLLIREDGISLHTQSGIISRELERKIASGFAADDKPAGESAPVQYLGGEITEKYTRSLIDAAGGIMLYGLRFNLVEETTGTLAAGETLAAGDTAVATGAIVPNDESISRSKTLSGNSNNGDSTRADSAAAITCGYLMEVLTRIGALERRPGSPGFEIGVNRAGEVVRLSEIDADGNRISVGGAHIAAMLLLANAAAGGEDHPVGISEGDRVALPYSAPKILDGVIRSIGAVPERYCENPPDEGSPSPEGAPLSYVSPPYLRYSTFAVVGLLARLHRGKTGLAGACRSLPDFTCIRKEITLSGGVSSADVMRNLYEGGGISGDGIRLDFESGSLRVLPLSCERVALICDAESRPAAEELMVNAAALLQYS